MTALVLVVEDDADFRRLVARMLDSWGLAVVEAGTVGEALSRATDLQPDTVVTDVGLPDGDGFDLTRRLLELPWEVRVIVISSDSGAGNRQAAQRAGAVGFLSKDASFHVAMRELVET